MSKSINNIVLKYKLTGNIKCAILDLLRIKEYSVKELVDILKPEDKWDVHITLFNLHHREYKIEYTKERFKLKKG